MKFILAIFIVLAWSSMGAADDIKTMTWNIWHGGIHGDKAGGFAEDEANTDNILKVIVENDPDIIFMQETYCCGMEVAKAAGYPYSQRGSSNLSIHSKYPIVEVIELFKPFNSHAVVIDVDGKEILCVNVWLNSSPDYFPVFEEATSEFMVEGEKKTRLVEIKAILDEIEKLEQASRMPILIGGDFNSSSHLDWIESTKKSHFNKVIKWPVTSLIEDRGYVDSFRKINPDPVTSLQGTWGYFTDGYLSDRIDYIFFRGKGIKAKKSDIIMDDPEGGFFNSDHRAILTEFELEN